MLISEPTTFHGTHMVKSHNLYLRNYPEEGQKLYSLLLEMYFSMDSN